MGSATTRFLYDGDQLIAEYTGSNALLRRYVNGAGVDEHLVLYDDVPSALTRKWLLADQQGSVIAGATDAGAIAFTNRYDEYGQPAAGNYGRIQYTGQMYLSEVGAYHYKARAYLASIGRFMQTDPVGYGAGMNLYAYVGDDPVDRTDPSGLFDCDSHSRIRVNCSAPQAAAIQQVQTGVAQISTLRRHVMAGTALTKSDKAVAKRVDEYMGKAVSGNPEKLSKLIEYGQGMLRELRGHRPVLYRGDNGDYKAIAAPPNGPITVYDQYFRQEGERGSDLTRAQAQTFAHEAGHYVIPGAIDFGTQGWDGRWYNYGREWAHWTALEFPNSTFRSPESVTFALGF